MTLEDLIASARFDTDDVAAGKLAEDEDLTRFFNEAQEEACIRKDLLFASEEAMCSISISAGQQRYKVSDRWSYITAARVVDPANATCTQPLKLISREDLNISYPGWQDRTGEPWALIRHDGSVELAAPLAKAWTLRLEGYRLPLKTLADDGDKPEIGTAHHRFLVHWVLHRVYAKPDAEIFNPEKSAKALAAFEQYFGLRPDADLRREQQADQPHHNLAYW